MKRYLKPKIELDQLEFNDVLALSIDDTFNNNWLTTESDVLEGGADNEI